MIWSICYSVSKSCAWVRHMQLPPETSLQNLAAKPCRANLAEDHRCLLQRLNTPILSPAGRKDCQKKNCMRPDCSAHPKIIFLCFSFFVDPIIPDHFPSILSTQARKPPPVESDCGGWGLHKMACEGKLGSAPAQPAKANASEIAGDAVRRNASP